MVEYIDGTLGAVVAVRVHSHVTGCARCADLLAELRVIDALLLEPRRLEPAPNFTFKTMAEIRARPQPRVHRAHAFGLFAAYLAFAWMLIAGWLLLGGSAAQGALALLTGTLARYAEGLGALATMTGNMFGHSTFGVTAAMAAILTLDLVFAGALAALYTIVRPRLLARLAHSTEGSIG